MQKVLLSIMICLSVSLNAEAQLTPQDFEFVPRGSITAKKLGVNAFANDQRFGTVRAQLSEVKQTLRLRFIRVLFAWNDQVQPSPSSRPNFSFYDDIVRNIPAGVDAIPVLTGLPSWMSDSSKWQGTDPRKTFVNLWVKKVIKRYRLESRIKGFQIWNEPDMSSNPDNVLLDMDTNPAQYVAMLSEAHKVMRRLARKKLVISAATTAINQDYPDTIEYNEGLKAAGIEAVTDIYAAHYYGSHYENVIFPGGVADFLNSVTKPIWITEIGETGINEQREYLERTMPFLLEMVPRIRRFYYYQFTEATPAESTYGLKNLTPGLAVSDLYIYLRDRAR